MLDKIVSVVNIVIVPVFVTILTIVLNKTIWDIQKRLKKIETKIFENDNIDNLMQQIDDAIEYIINDANIEYKCIIYDIFNFVREDTLSMISNNVNLKFLAIVKTMMESTEKKIYDKSADPQITYQYRKYKEKIIEVYKDAYNNKQIRIIKIAKDFILDVGDVIWKKLVENS